MVRGAAMADVDGVAQAIGGRADPRASGIAWHARTSLAPKRLRKGTHASSALSDGPAPGLGNDFMSKNEPAMIPFDALAD